ncbi:uncharacterized protein THITE_2112052 [Thermothielavioides terrestris NRRL 8126]|uniref:Uncharacterized protein n=1 Tax=Thermothielavioides terrestris (strain ATCC 38088 / NRRL 8126) TaxID=578455 RepID=G2R4K6_THETT|nr:uncharacterized protein THITE_2112052 [Thermothielavioides terrestris NRRL 8126]AEO65241.1 hypothetical protein THITE_2112052 [Thermothielavioides terrestris NRRL 8126]
MSSRNTPCILPPLSPALASACLGGHWGWDEGNATQNRPRCLPPGINPKKVGRLRSQPSKIVTMDGAGGNGVCHVDAS